jgi:hypothetical protein
MTLNPGARQGVGRPPLKDQDLPPERSESTDVTPEAPLHLTVHARRYVDADLRATASLDAKIRACLVPGLRSKPPLSNGS